MELHEFIHLIKNKKQTIAIVTILFVLFSVAFTFVQPMRYSSVSKVLVIQDLPDGVDPYQVSKSNEYVASLLTQVVSSNSFYKNVLSAGFNIDQDYFPETSDKQMKLWRKIVKVDSNSNGIITIKSYHDNRIQVGQLSQAINFILETKHSEYHGFGDTVKIKIIEQPVTSDRPIQPNVYMNISVAIAFGILVSLTYIYLFPGSRYNLRLTPKGRDALASADIQPGRDEFEINNHEQRSVNIKEEIKAIRTAKINNINSNNIEQSNRPANLPVVEQAQQSPVVENVQQQVARREPRDIKKQGSMENIINQTNQRT